MGSGTIAARSAGQERRFDALGRLEALADEIEARRTELEWAIVATSKKTIRIARGEVELAIRRLRAFRPDIAPLLDDRVPLGTIGVVFPSNASLSNPVATLGNAVLAGNRARARFPSAAKAWAQGLEPLLCKHLPEVAFDHGPGRAFLSGVIDDPEVAVTIVFGDDAWAAPYEERVRRQRKKLIFEGPGNDPFLVLPGADVERAAVDAVRAGFYNAGQACTSPERFYVHRPLADEFLERTVTLARQLVVGEPEREDVDIGPILGEHIARRIEEHLQDARRLGARVLTGGGVHQAFLHETGDGPAEIAAGFQGAGDPALRGLPVTYVEPTVLEGVDNRMRIMVEETFGPVIAVQVVDTPEEALRLAEDSDFGLAANLYGGTGTGTAIDTAAARLAESHGQVFRDETWLDYFSRCLHAPYGGRKRSGWVWATENDRFVRRDGVRTNALEFSRPA